MEIKLKKLTLRNFKGIRSQEIDFDNVTNIYGDNGTGKTTIFDAFNWLLFGKDSHDRSDFNIKTLGPDNQPFHHLDHEVSASLVMNGTPLTLRRCLTENWVKKRGEEKQEFSGHTTSFFWNDVPMSKADYEAKINYHIDSSIFKLVTNTSYFNQLNWQERRSILLAISGEISNEDVLESLMTVTNKQNFTALINALNQGKTMEEYKREIASKKKLIKDELQMIPARIDEADRSLPEPKNYKEIQTAIDEKTAALQELDTQLSDRNKANKAQNERIQALTEERAELMNKASDMEFNIRESVKAGLKSKKMVLNDLRGTKEVLNQKLRKLEEKKAEQIRNKVEAHEGIKSKTALADSLRNQWREENAKEIEFDESKFECPTCKRAHDESDIEDLKEKMLINFNEAKAKKLAEISNKGKSLKNEIETLQSMINNIDSDSEERELQIISAKSEIVDVENKMTEIQKEIDRLEIDVEPAIAIKLSEDKDYQFTLSNIRELKEKIEAPTEAQNNEDIQGKKQKLNAELDKLKAELSTKEQRERIQKRIQELKEKEKSHSQELADLEAIDFSIEEFTVAKMNALEESLNNRFDLVKFKLFKEQINGGRTETCETLIDGVPYSDANTASKINAGIDIINTLSEHYKVYAPVFIDNAESVNQLIPSKSQINRLIVSKDKTLRIDKLSPEKTTDSALQSSSN